MHITIISIGKIKEKYWKTAGEVYIKRLKPYCKLTIKELPNIPFGPSDNTEIIKSKEFEQIKKHLNKNDFNIFLNENGKEFTSTDFAEFLEEKTKDGTHITFIIGGALGHAREAKEFTNMSLALSQMTFLHEMAKIILLEQIYRGITIQKGKTYHY